MSFNIQYFISHHIYIYIYIYNREDKANKIVMVSKTEEKKG